jgi:site-specific recombinase XerD
MNIQKINTLSALPVGGLCNAYAGDVSVFNRWAAGRPVNGELITEYFNRMMEAGRAPATIQRNKCAIKKAVVMAMGQGARLIDRAAMDQFFKEIQTGRRDVSAQDRSLSKAELKELKRVSGYKTGLIVQALFETAARVSELISVRLDKCEQRPEGVVIKTIGKRKKERTFYMSEKTFLALREAYAGKVYLLEHEGKPLSRFTVSALVKKAGKKIGRRIGAHSLRHTWASLNLEAGMSLPKVSGYLGHEDTSTTAKFYIHGRPVMSEIMIANVLLVS